MLLGGRAAEQVVYGQVSTGAANDLTKATDIVKRMITEYGMSEKFRNVVLTQQRAPLLGAQAESAVIREYAESTQSYVDEEIARIVNQSYETVLATLRDNRESLEMIAKKLLEVETLDEKAFQTMLDARTCHAKENRGRCRTGGQKMLKNMKMGAKLVLVGSLLIVIPLAVVSVVAIQRATSGLTAIENEQLSSRAAVIAEMIDRVFAEEQKIALSLSADPDIVAAAKAVAASGEEPTPTVKGGKIVATGTTTADLVTRADQKLKAMAATKGLGEAYEGLILAASDGRIFISSTAGGVGVNISDRDYFKTAMAGRANVGAAARSKVTNKPVTPIIAPIVAGNQVVGAVALIADIGFLNDIIANQRIGKSGYTFVIDKTGLAIAHPNAEKIFTLDIGREHGMEEISRKMINGERGTDSYVYQGVAKTAGFAPVKATGGASV